MADYSNIIDELQIIANAFDDVSYFLYNRVSAVNGTQNAKGYPLIISVLPLISFAIICEIEMYKRLRRCKKAKLR
jgi:hypothetical protein